MPIEFRCTHCQKLLQTPEETTGKQAKCPQCGSIQQIPAATNTPPPGSPFAPGAPTLGPVTEAPFGEPSGPIGPDPSRADYGASPSAWAAPVLRVYALNRVGAPASVLIMAGSLGLAIQLLGATFSVIRVAAPNLIQLGRGGGRQMLVGGAAVLFGSLLGIAVSMVMILGGLKMKRLENYAWAMAGAIVALIPLPCLSPCCLLGLPFGIWALVVLNDPQVRLAFQR